MVLMSFSFVYPFTTTLGFEYTPLQIAVATLVFLLLFSILLINGIMTKVSAISFVSGGILVTIYSFFNGSLTRLTAPFVWIYNYIQGNESQNKYYAIVFTLLFTFAFSLIVYIFTIKKFNFYILCLTGISIFCIQWMFDYFVKNRAYVSFYTFIISILIYYLLHIYNKKWAQESNDFAPPSSFILFTAPIALLVLFLTVYIPVSPKPIEWKWLDEKLYFAMNYNGGNTSKLMDSEYFTLASTGFGNSSSKLGGNVTPDNTHVLNVLAPKILYLKGRSSDQYTGSSWINTDISYYDLYAQNNKMNFDTFELENGLFLLSDSYKNLSESNLAVPDIFTNVSKYTIDVSYENITTNSLFAPLKTSNLKFPNSAIYDYFVNAEGVLISRKSLGKGFTYSFDTYGIKYGDVGFENFMRVSRRYLYDTYLEQALDEITNYIDLNIVRVANEHDIRKSDINQMLLEAQSTELMKENLERYLLGSFTVSLYDSPADNFDATISAAKSCISIIDSQHFYGNNQDLFEWIISLNSLKDNSRAMHSRYLAIPDAVPLRVKELAVSITKNESNNYDKVKAIEQYLSKNYKYSLTPGALPDGVDFADNFLFERKEGYCTYFATSMAILTRSIGLPSRYVEGYLLPSKLGNDNIYKVTNQQAHAWVEVYFEGIGWIQFEPTASFASNLYQTTQKKQPVQTPSPTLSTLPSSSINPGSTNNLPKEETHNGKAIDPKLLITITTVMTVLLLLFLIVFMNVYRRKRLFLSFTKLPPREGVIKLYSYFMKYMSFQNADIKAGETPMDHAKRLDTIERFFPYKLEEITVIFVNARYSREEITTSDFNRILDFYHPLLKSTKEKVGTIKYMLYMYFLFRF